jgi:ferric-dicitrate binding protein FerR (iron transport regulator)
MEQRYSSFTSLQLATEPAFISWVYEGVSDAEWKAWLKAHPDKEVLIEEAKRIALDLRTIAPYRMSEGEKTALWNRIVASAQPAQKQSTLKIRALMRWGIAAAAALALIVWVTIPGRITTIVAKAGEQKNIILPDQSAIAMNAGSDITYAPRTFKKERTVRLDGEAFFEVEPGTSFTVETPKGTITVLGTSFNVIAREDRFEVSCYTGKVSVVNHNKAEQVLTAGDRAIGVNDRALNRSTFTVTDAKPDWTRGKFVFTGQPLQVVVDELARQYNVRVTLEPGLDTMRYVGLFESGDLSEAVKLITWPLTLDAQIKDNTVSIARKR